MTYDSLEVLDTFHFENQLQFPLLHDPDAKHVNAYGVRDPDYSFGHSAYGVPQAGMLFVSAQGLVRDKFAVPGYRDRPRLDEVYAAIAERTR